MIDNIHLEKIKEEERKVRMAIQERLVGYILAAFGLVAGLAWNDVIKSFIEAIFPVSAINGLIARLIYAVILTVAIAVFAYYISKFFIQEKK